MRSGSSWERGKGWEIYLKVGCSTVRTLFLISLALWIVRAQLIKIVSMSQIFRFWNRVIVVTVFWQGAGVFCDLSLWYLDTILSLIKIVCNLFCRYGRVNYVLARRLELLREVGRLQESLGVPGDVSYTCETAGHFFLYQVRTEILLQRLYDLNMLQNTL